MRKKIADAVGVIIGGVMVLATALLPIYVASIHTEDAVVVEVAQGANGSNVVFAVDDYGDEWGFYADPGTWEVGDNVTLSFVGDKVVDAKQED